jgi:hypothetical protein
MNRQGSSFLGMRTHHFVIALIAILIAIAWCRIITSGEAALSQSV